MYLCGYSVVIFLGLKWLMNMKSHSDIKATVGSFQADLKSLHFVGILNNKSFKGEQPVKK